MANKWIVSWQAAVWAGGRSAPSKREQEAFDDLKEAVKFAMGLDETCRTLISCQMSKTEQRRGSGSAKVAHHRLVTPSTGD
jgi:hypothetical protein